MLEESENRLETASFKVHPATPGIRVGQTRCCMEKGLLTVNRDHQVKDHTIKLHPSTTITVPVTNAELTTQVQVTTETTRASSMKYPTSNPMATESNHSALVSQPKEVYLLFLARWYQLV